jgi:exonuclease VII large subunit
MKESFIMKLSFLGSVIGLVAIYIIVSHMAYEPVKIGSITGQMVGETINITGAVKNVYVHEDGHVFISLFDETGEVKVVVWSDTAGKLDETIKKGDFLNIIGNVQLYMGELEIIAREVNVL